MRVVLSCVVLMFKAVSQNSDWALSMCYTTSAMLKRESKLQQHAWDQEDKRFLPGIGLLPAVPWT